MPRFTCVRAQDKCNSCGYPVMTRAFYVFPCQHRFHSDCLIDEVNNLIRSLCGVHLYTSHKTVKYPRIYFTRPLGYLSVICKLITKTMYMYEYSTSEYCDCGFTWLFEQVLPHLTSSTRRKVQELQRKLASTDTSPAKRSNVKTTADSTPIARQLSQRSVKVQNVVYTSSCRN